MPKLNYDIVPDKSPLYTTVDQLNQSTADLQVTATNASSAAVTIKAIEIELKKVVQGVDTVQLLLPGSESGIGCPNTLIGPGGSKWTITKDDGKLTITADAGATFQPRDTLGLTLQNVVIRAGATGTAFVRVIEASDAGKAETTPGIGITQSKLDVQLLAHPLLIEPGGAATLQWTTRDASSGALTLPENFPSSITLDPNTNLTSGEQAVSPIVDTTYSLTCQGHGPNVTRQVTISVDSLQMTDIETSKLTAVQGEKVLLRWRTNADACTLDDGHGSAAVDVPSTVPNDQFPDGYPVYPAKPTAYKVQGRKKLSNGFISTDHKTVDVDVPPVSITYFLINGQSAADVVFFDNEGSNVLGVLTWEVEHSSSCSLSCVTNPIIPPQDPVPVGAKGKLLLERTGTYGLEIYRHAGEMRMVWTLTCEGYNGPVEKTVAFNIRPRPWSPV